MLQINSSYLKNFDASLGICEILSPRVGLRAKNIPVDSRSVVTAAIKVNKDSVGLVVRQYSSPLLLLFVLKYIILLKLTIQILLNIYFRLFIV